ncbi:Uncharacterised protein [Mycobacteroides abscessus subsp. abscessus]|nr:Uncharacterised protein [Mycobacteroides abscessus subsp. abscessus]
MLPYSAWLCAPPSSSRLTSSPVTSRITLGPVTNMYASSVATTTSVLIGAYTAPPAHLPRIIDTCGTSPDSGSCLRPSSAYQASEVTASCTRAPPESLMPTTGQPTLAAYSMM